MIYIFIVLILAISFITIALIELNLKLSERKLEVAISYLDLVDHSNEIDINSRMSRKEINQIKFAKRLDQLTDLNSVKKSVKDLWITKKEQFQQWIQQMKEKDLK
ncbi:hypothetical protein ACWV26_09640 [Rummeliibacillus sp. JY-2-4R]